MARLLITGDVHGEFDVEKLYPSYFPEGRHLTKEDFIIVCGDFGMIWDYRGMSAAERNRLNWLNERPWTTLFVDGNHECFPRLNSYPIKEWNGGKVHQIEDSIFHLMRGEVYDIDGIKLFAFGGAQSTDKQYRIIGKSWWPEEEPSMEEYNNAIKNLERINYEPDIIITHEAPMDYKNLVYGSRSQLKDKTSLMLHDILCLCPNYGHWYCGHHHMDLKANDRFDFLYWNIVEFKRGEK